MSDKCNLSSCSYNHNGICHNEEKRKECVEVSKAVLRLEHMGTKFTNITSAVKHIGKYDSEEMIETSAITDNPVIFADNEQDRVALGACFMNENNALKPCPFCGGEAEVIKAHSSFPLPYMVICKNEDCGASVGKFRKTREEAISVWNRRTCDCKKCED